MRKRLLSILLSVLLCLALVSPQAAAADIYFVAVDDSVPLTLPSSMSPFFSGSTLYVPSSVFEAAPGGVTPSYNASGQTLVLFRSGARLIFNLANGTVTGQEFLQYLHRLQKRNDLSPALFLHQPFRPLRNDAQQRRGLPHPALHDRQRGL